MQFPIRPPEQSGCGPRLFLHLLVHQEALNKPQRVADDRTGMRSGRYMRNARGPFPS